MSNLENTVVQVVEEFLKNEVLFTALDVSNAVKQVLPQARHREVRDLVRDLFVSKIQHMGWARTGISVNLEDGNTVEALLYHPLPDSWDLDNKYDKQKRAQASYRPFAQAQATVTQAQTVVVPVAQAVTPMPTASTLWDNMFKTQPSLFPSK